MYGGYGGYGGFGGCGCDGGFVSPAFGYGGGCGVGGVGFGGGFALIVVLFILLIIIGACWCF
ncbi:YjcZ family sporulation protein [Bacillus norwichensis]|uniref:YjcZ family sporulation protein n=1 Tax=Bacillus norwichensis TaxID=2762217 RepID=A0ABR8VJD8_9BACI|nr:YjcZ family sporulation protein [Bacillus norwichensis]MBD8004892.1 YjcZ family sporulation protein [Bacillus norwichensis]